MAIKRKPKARKSLANKAGAKIRGAKAKGSKFIKHRKMKKQTRAMADAQLARTNPQAYAGIRKAQEMRLGALQSLAAVGLNIGTASLNKIVAALKNDPNFKGLSDEDLNKLGELVKNTSGEGTKDSNEVKQQMKTSVSPAGSTNFGGIFG